MIRRDIDLGDGRACWLLVSQVEHARLSAVLAERCLNRFGQSSFSGAAASQIESTRRELLQAITRHDDGWTQWETRPGLDPERRRPLSFRELPLGQSLLNWESSIQSAADVGPLAAWVVSGHFAALLETSEKDHDRGASAKWLAKTADQRVAWLAEWQALNPAQHTTRLADEALVWLQTFDVMSLWICSVCPAGGEKVSQWPQAHHIGPSQMLDMRIGPDRSADVSQRSTVIVDPWRFDVPELEIEAAAHVVPVRQYQNTGELLAAYKPLQLRWRLTPLSSS
ncbi:MAG: DUF3891 family protein [Planctomycetes bacterium]|nr:DUF3891 family protein [Planctomycetota bacterium]